MSIIPELRYVADSSLTESESRREINLLSTLNMMLYFRKPGVGGRDEGGVVCHMRLQEGREGEIKFGALVSRISVHDEKLQALDMSRQAGRQIPLNAKRRAGLSRYSYPVRQRRYIGGAKLHCFVLMHVT